MTTVALIDDHTIFSDSLSSLIDGFDGFKVIWTAADGDSAIQTLEKTQQIPDIILLDVIMPGMSGIEVAKWLFEHQKTVKVLVLTMEEDDQSVISMLQYGVRGYLLKNINADELHTCLLQVVKYGYYYTPIVAGNIHKQFEKKTSKSANFELTDREKELLQYMCTDMSYSKIASKMFLSESTVDSHRAKLFEKFDVKNRIGLILKAVAFGLARL